MSPSVRASATVGMLALGTALGALAQAPAPATAASAPARSQRTVIEDDGVRIEETRVRGQTRRVVVQSKVGEARPYEIVTTPGGRDKTQERGAAGQSTWSILDF
jgi:hypothetical protein